jgi:beta-1,3-galactosyl-O-glycosyl-glycoprotein beta-1,6-N-acetylglucosaminyltransferase/N-acetyllactosaminide beta-1,6-N-acetylglucosaminyltransferase/mucin type N-acetylglucosaminyltransferase 3
MTSDCAAFRRSYGFDEISLTSATDFPLAFNILAHVSAHQLTRLLRAIYRPQNVYCVHVDAHSSSDLRTAVDGLAACFPNVRLASRLEAIVYAGFSRLQADITCMRDHMTSHVNWRYLINTAAQAFPLRTNEELVAILREYNGANDIEGIYGHRVLRGRFENEWVENRTRWTMEKTGRKNPPPPHDIDIVRGSAYGVFSRAFVRFILEDRKARDLLDWARTTWSPDEFYWATLHHTYSNPHLHTPGGFSGYPSSKPWLAVYANWGETLCHGKYVHGVCVFGVGDLQELIERRELFANKFHADFQPLALDCLDAWIRHKEICPPSTDYTYYSKLPFVFRN